MRFLLFLLCCLSLTGCLRTPLLENKPDDDVYRKKLIGLSRDEIIIRYGPPDRTATLSHGVKLMQYTSSVRYLHRDKSRSEKECTLRLWLRENRVIDVTALGARMECDAMLLTYPRNERIDMYHEHFTY